MSESFTQADRRVMLVDDDPMLLAAVGRNLAFDYDLQTATSGAEALDKLEEHGAVGVIVTDMRMPRMDGIEFIARARKIAPKASYIMLTGNQDGVTAQRAVGAGQVLRFLNKPCSVDEIRGAINSGLAAAATAGAAQH